MKKEIICGVYKITSPSGRIYIGESKNVYNRWSKYKLLNCKDQLGLYNSLLKYTAKEHSFEIIEECSFEELKCRERFWQDFYDVLKKGLNCKLTKCGELKTEVSEETRQKIGKAHKGKVVSSETRKKLSEGRLGNKNWMYGTKMSNETKEKIKNSIGEIHFNIGRKQSKETRDKRWKTLGGVNANSEAVINTETGEIFNCIKDAAVALNLKYTTLHGYLKGRYPNKTSIKYFNK